MKRLTIHFKNGDVVQIETKTDLSKVIPVEVNGASVIHTEEGHVINMENVASIDVEQPVH